MIITRITILSLLFIFCSVTQVWAGPSGTFKGTFGQEDIKMEKLGEGDRPDISYKKDDESALDNRFLESPGTNRKFSLVESVDSIFSLYQFVQTPWRYKFFDLQGIKERESSNSEYEQSILKLYPNRNSYLEDHGIQEIFEIFQSKLKKAEMFIFLHLSFNPNWKPMLLEMDLSPSSDKGVDFYIPF